MNISMYFTVHLADNKGCDSEHLKCYPDHCSREMVSLQLCQWVKKRSQSVSQTPPVTQIDCYEDKLCVGNVSLKVTQVWRNKW